MEQKWAGLSEKCIWWRFEVGPDGPVMAIGDKMGARVNCFFNLEPIELLCSVRDF